MRSWKTSLLLLALAVFLAPACGTGGQNRPSVVGNWPGTGNTSPGPLPFVRVDYNEPVTFLNVADYRVTVNGGGFSTFITRFADQPNSVFIYPSGRTAFPADSSVAVFISQGLVINGLDHYASDTAAFTVFSGSDDSLPVGEVGAVSLVNCITGATDETVAVPGAHDPVGVLSTTRGTERRIWVQLDSGGGVSTSLAWFAPGDGAMTPVALTSTGDLTTPAQALAIDPLGDRLYAAFRDEGSDSISVHVIDTATAMETDVLVLESQAPSATAVPRGLALAPGTFPAAIHVTTEDAGGGTVARIQRSTFTEIDADTTTMGTQGVALPNGGGPCVVTDTRTWVAHDIASDITRAPATGTAADLPGTVTGTTTSLALSPTGILMLQGLTGFAGTEMLQGRNSGAGFATPFAFEVSDDVGGMSTGATAVIGVQWLASSDNFLVVLDTPGGAVLTEWVYLGGASVEQVDLDDGTDGIQGIDLASSPIVLGSNHGPYPD